MSRGAYTMERAAVLERAAKALARFQRHGGDIAAIAGWVRLSPKTVRRVLNHSPSASTKAAALVLRGLREKRQQLPLLLPDQRSLPL